MGFNLGFKGLNMLHRCVLVEAINCRITLSVYTTQGTAGRN